MRDYYPGVLDTDDDVDPGDYWDPDADWGWEDPE